MCQREWPTGTSKCATSGCPLHGLMDRDPCLSFKLGAVFELADGTDFTVKHLGNNIVKALTLLSPDEAYDMCMDKFSGNMSSLGNHLLAEMRGKQFDGLFAFRSVTAFNRHCTCSLRKYYAAGYWNVVHVYSILQVVCHSHTLPRLCVGADTAWTCLILFHLQFITNSTKYRLFGWHSFTYS